MSIPVYVISLKGSDDRRARIEREFEAIGLEFEFFDAVDGRGFDVPNHPEYDAARRRRYFGKDLTGGELGCTLSHKHLYQKMVDEGIERALLFEDDVILREGFLAVLKSLENCPVPYDMIRFLGSPKLERLKMRPVGLLDDKHWLTRHSGMPGGTHASLMTLGGAQKVLPHMQRNVFPVDALMGRSWETGLDWYTVRPGLAAQDLSFESDIEGERLQKSLDVEGCSKILYPFTRAWFKFSETIGKKYWYFKTWFKDKNYITR
ncbi:MAG: glycosyltransferase family 25 protein [Alphaproteobacteria bacterium]|nr:glycosyltransferase family 25 protein [Alphaproteobacteria bacterium]